MKTISLWTDEINHDLECKIMECFNKTFSQTKSREYFQWKFRENPFGKSLHIIVLDKNKVVATRVFWRLDISNLEAYQCVDTSVLPKYQKKGIFGNTANAALKILKGKLIYNYPNNSSGPLYLKYGWNVIKNSKTIYANLTSLMTQDCISISWNSSVLKWRFERNPEAIYYLLEKNSKYYLFSKKKFGLFNLLGRINSKLSLDQVEPFICVSYDRSSLGIPIYAKLPFMFYGNLNNCINMYLFDMA